MDEKMFKRLISLNFKLSHGEDELSKNVCLECESFKFFTFAWTSRFINFRKVKQISKTSFVRTRNRKEMVARCYMLQLKGYTFLLQTQPSITIQNVWQVSIGQVARDIHPRLLFTYT